MLSSRTLLKRAWQLRCPQCGETPLFEKWGVLREKCPNCGLEIRARETHTWFFMYVSTAAISGLFIIGMLLIQPKNLFFGQIILLIISIITFFGTAQLRKSLALAWEVFIDRLC